MINNLKLNQAPRQKFPKQNSGGRSPHVWLLCAVRVAYAYPKGIDTA